MATLLQIRDRVRTAADIVSETARYPDAELNGYINDSYRELVKLLARHSLQRDTANQTVTTTGAATYPMPADHVATVAVYRYDGCWIELDKKCYTDRPFGATQNDETGTACAYDIKRLAGTKSIEFYPRPSGEDYVISYIPFTALSSDTDVANGATDYEDYIVYDATIACLLREGSSIADAAAKFEEVKSQVKADARTEEMGKTYMLKAPRRRLRGPGDTGRRLGVKDY